MKKLILTLLLVCATTFTYAQKTNSFERFDTNGMQSRILKLQGLTSIDDYQNKTNNTYGFYQVYKDIQQFDIDKRFPSLEVIKERAKQSYFDNIIPLAVMHSEYDMITETALRNNAISVDGEYLMRNTTENIFEQKSITISAPLRVHKDGLSTQFILSSEMIFNTTNSSITSIEADFSDGTGFQKIRPNEVVSVSFSEAGTKEITLQVTLSNGETHTSRSKILVRPSSQDATSRMMTINNITASITPDLSVYGEATSYPGEGEYQIFMSTEAGAVLDKPIIIIDGFDPGNLRPIEGFTDATTGDYTQGIYDLFSYTNSSGAEVNMADEVRAEGFDVVILNFPEYTRAADGAVVDGGADFVERNAMILVELINTLNADKVGSDQNVIIGPSMGGLISRYALNYMEANSLNHDVRLWLSFDSPHLGANVPIGFQFLFNYLAYGLDVGGVGGDQSIESLRPIVDGMLKSAAARQMLTDHFEPHLSSGSEVDFDPNKTLPVNHPFGDTFYSSLNSFTASGFPENLRKISIINGSGVNSRYPAKPNHANAEILPGAEVLNTTIENSGADVTMKVNFTPTSGQTIVTGDLLLETPIWCIFCSDIDVDASSQAYTYSNGIDAASGGLFDLGALQDGFDADPLISDFFAALQTDYFNFIPTVSAMALDNNGEIDWFHQPTSLVTGRTVNNITPFDAWYMPDDNEPHVTLTQANVDFAWNEIVLAVLNTQEQQQQNAITIANNPVKNTLTILNTAQAVKGIDIQIFDLAGKQVFKHLEATPSNQINLPITLTSGIYITKIQTENTTINQKIIVE